MAASLRATYTRLTNPTTTAQSLGYIWIPGAAMGPFDIADGGDEIGEWGGANTATTEVLTYLMPLPADMDITAAITVQDYLLFDGVSDSDVFEIDHLYDTAATDAVNWFRLKGNWGFVPLFILCRNDIK